MQAYIGIIILCAVPGLVSCIVHEISNKERSGIALDKSYINHILKTAVFYILMFYSFLSVLKTVLGDGALTLAESFEDVSAKTYLHYSLPLVIVSIAAPYILRRLLKERADDFVLMALSTTTGIDLIIHLIFAQIDNLWCGAAALIGIVTAFLSVFFNKKKVSYCTLATLKKRLKFMVPVMLFWVVLMVLYLPNELYLGNANDMEVPYGIFVRTLLIGALFYFILYTFITVYFLTGRQFILMCEIVFSISLMCLLQSMVLNGKMDVLDGSRQEWSALTTAVNVVIWLAATAIIIALRYITKKNTVRIYSIICIYLSLIQLITWAYLGFNADIKKAEKRYELTTEARFDLDSDHNVLVFVLDWFDGQILDRIIADDETILEPLKDFTWYKNASSSYAFTDMSIPYMLTGTEWEYDMSETEYSEYVFSNPNMLDDIADRNYDIGVYTGKKYISEGLRNYARNFSDITMEGWNYSGIVRQMISCAKYKAYPFALKGRYWYADGEMARSVRYNTVHDVTYDEPFNMDLRNNGLEVRKSDKYDGAFRFYHLHGMHTPFDPDMISQGEYCLGIVYEYLRQLKEAGLYDEATIIITADHGQNYISDKEKLDKYDFDAASSPILFVKKSGQHNDRSLPTESMAPVSHTEFAAALIEAVGGDTSKYGDAFEDIPEDADRTRYFVYRRHDDIPYAKYAINGYVRDWSNWTLVEHD